MRPKEQFFRESDQRKPTLHNWLFIWRGGCTILYICNGTQVKPRPRGNPLWEKEEIISLHYVYAIGGRDSGRGNWNDDRKFSSYLDTRIGGLDVGEGNLLY
jgi:hypothetical protein